MQNQRREKPQRRRNPSGKIVYVARPRDAEGKRHYLGTRALQRDAQMLIDAFYDGPPKRDLLGGYAEDWTARHPRSKRTNVTNDGRVRQVLDVEIDGRKLRDWPFGELRRKHTLALVDHMLREQGRATTGAVNIVRALSAMAEDAITDEIVGVNPFKGVRVRKSDPRALKQPKKARVLSWEEAHALAAAAGLHEPMVRTLADCGLRVGELFALRRDQQDLRGGLFVVEGTAWEGRVVPSSAEKEHDRAGPIPPGCLALLRSMPVRIDSPWLFPTRTGLLWQINNFYRDVWRPACEASGIVATPHDLRHSWVSNLSAAGIDHTDLADIAGHGEGVQARYRHALRRSYDEVRKAIG